VYFDLLEDFCLLEDLFGLLQLVVAAGFKRVGWFSWLLAFYLNN
jgi:hypothetical protein